MATLPVDHASLRDPLEDTPTGAASLADALHNDCAANLTFAAGGTQQNSGLALAAAAERLDAEETLAIATHLLFSPMFWQAVSDFHTEERLILRTDPVDAADQEHLALRILCARMFLAGRQAATQEAR